MRLKPPRLYSYSFFTLLIIISSTCQSLRIVNILDLTSKFIPYRRALDWQHSLVEQHISFKEHPKQEVYGSLLVLQHNPVYTLGTGTISNSGPFRNLCSDGKELLYETVRVDRAGEATFHGPGQIVLYPILDLVRKYSNMYYIPF